jgi:hypothetical protein
MVRAAQKGSPAASLEVAKVAGEMKAGDAKKFAKTKHKGLPYRAKPRESLAMAIVNALLEAPVRDAWSNDGEAAEEIEGITQRILGLTVNDGNTPEFQRHLASARDSLHAALALVDPDHHDSQHDGAAIDAENADVDDVQDRNPMRGRFGTGGEY